MRLSLPIAVCLTVFSTVSARGACINKFLHQTDGPRQKVTLLTGKLTFQTAQELASAIRDKKAGPVEWVDEKGKTISRQFGELKVVKPIAVGCDGNSSGVIMTVSFPSAAAPVKKMFVKFNPTTTVEFEEQQ